MTLKTLVLFVIPSALAVMGAVTLLVTRWQKKHLVPARNESRAVHK